VANAKGAVVIVGGRAEPAMKYAELVDDLNANGYSTYALDHRGHGASDRMLPTHDKCYVKFFSDYVSDLHAFITQVVQPDAPKATFLLAHSMGGAVAVLYADAHPETLTAMALSSPMLDINTGGFPAPVAASLGLEACSMGDGTAYAIGAGDWVEPTSFASDAITTSEPRWTWYRQLLVDNPPLRLGGYTWQWLCEALNGASAAQSVGRFSAVPTLLFQAGKDTVVKPGGQELYCREAPRCQLTRIADGKHELLVETDALRNQVLEQTLKFFAARSAP
jgi:lysophospholipase